jgi:hypothetical protein
MIFLITQLLLDKTNLFVFTTNANMPLIKYLRHKFKQLIWLLFCVFMSNFYRQLKSSLNIQQLIFVDIYL